MSLTTLVQIFASCVGVVGSLFFAVGIMRQSVEAMGRLSGSYWDSNPHMPPMLAAQKADYLFGGCLIFLAFVVQFASFLVSEKCMILNAKQAQLAPWVTATTTAIVFVLLRFASCRLARYYEVQINEWLKKRSAP